MIVVESTGVLSAWDLEFFLEPGIFLVLPYKDRWILPSLGGFHLEDGGCFCRMLR